MKKIVKGKTYNTATAVKLGECKIPYSSKYPWVYGHLYRKKDGEYFLLVRGVPEAEFNGVSFLYHENEYDDYENELEYGKISVFQGEGIVPLFRQIDIDYYLKKIDEED